MAITISGLNQPKGINFYYEYKSNENVHVNGGHD